MFRAPRPASLPGITQLVQSLPATPRQVARHLDLADRTLQRYIATDSAPRAVMLALFWETRWGRETADNEAAVWSTIQYRRAEGLERQVAELRRQIGVLEGAQAEGWTAANSPIWMPA